MSDYISREELKLRIHKKIEDIHKEPDGTLEYADAVFANGMYRALDLVEHIPSADVIPLSVLQEIKNKIEDCSFNHYFEYGEYIGENPIQHRICMTDKVLEILSEYVKGGE